MNATICWVCGKKLGSRFNQKLPQTYAVVQDPIGNEHPTHHVCVKDADGKQVRTEALGATKEKTA